MYKLLISLKYLKGRLITACSILFVALGVMALIVVNSVMSGFQKEFKSRLRGTLSHMTVRLNSPDEYAHYSQVVSKTAHVASVAPRKEGLVLLAAQGHVQGCKVLGIDPVREYEVGKLRSYLMTPHRMLHERLADAQERGNTVAWELAGVAVDSKSRRRAYFVERTTSKALKPGGAPFEMERKQAIRFRADGVVEFHWRKLLKGFPESKMQTSGKAFDETKRWFDAFNAEVGEKEIERAVARFDEKLGINTMYLDPDAPFKIAGGRVKHTEPGVIVGHELFRQLRLQIGVSRLELITAKIDPAKKPVKGQPIKQDNLQKEGRIFVVTGSFKTGMNEYDTNFLYAPYGVMKEFLDKGRGNQISVRLTDFTHADDVRRSLRPHLKVSMYVQTWRDKRKNLLRAVDMERGVMFVIMFFFILFAVVTIAVILILLVVEKYRDIGILKSMGATSWGVASIFVSNGIVAGGIGCALGTAGGVAFATHVNEIADFIYDKSGFRVFPRDVYYLDRIPSDIDPVWITGTVGIALVLCLFCCLVPAWKAGRLQVVDTLKWE